jgi:putative ABC transport system permease protein
VSLVSIILITGFTAGSYPAFYLSSFQPASILKGKSALQLSNSLLRRSLVVFQFVIAITLVCGMILVTRQLKYMQEENLGFSSSHKIVLPLRTQTAQANYFTLRNELSKISTVNNVTATDNIPGSKIFSDFGLYPEGSSMEKSVLVKNTWVQPNYLELMGIKLIAGRNFPETVNSESWNKVIINRSGARALGFTPEKIAGEKLYFDWQGDRYEFEVIGVMEDYHQLSLREEISPVLFRVNENPNHDFAIADVNSENISQTLAQLESTWKATNSDTPFEYSFLDENIQKQYAEDKKISMVITTFTIIAMIISCLGLYGLSTYMAEKRFKEIGVRKVLGASVQQIVVMMSNEFVRLVLISFVISVPLSFYAMTRWLEGFAYHISPDLSLYVLAGSAALLIAVLTISFESIRAASGNPINALRNE